MPIFEYTALNKLGRHERGTIDAESLEAARRELRAARVHVVRIGMGDSDARQAAARRTAGGGGRVRARDVAVAARQLAILLRAGMAVTPALDALVEQLSGQPLAGVMAGVRDRVNQGATLASAMAEHPRAFPELFVNMVRAGEAAGALDTILWRLAEMSEKRINLAGKVKAAMVYPAVLAVVGAAVVMFLMAFVIPSVSKLFVEMKRALPWPTVSLMAVSGFVRDYFWVVCVAAVALWMAGRSWARAPAGRLAWDRLKLRTPVLGDLILKSAVARFARTLGVLLASGVPILDALAIVKRLVGNAVITEALDAAGESVGKGDSIAEPIRRSGVFPPLVYHMIAVGESSGNVEDRLVEVAEAYENEVETKTVALTSLVEPLMILIMGCVVGFIVLAILLPIFEINEVIR